MTDRIALVAVLADTLVPALEDAGDDAVAAFRRRAASDLGVADLLAPALTETQAALIDELGSRGFAALDLAARTAMLHELARELASRQALRELKLAVMGIFYALPGPDDRNPNWTALGFPGPASAPPSPAQAPKTIAIERLDGPATIVADVCIVGSGAGGSVIAAELQAAGHQVVVLERAGYRNEADFRQLELVGANELYLHGGLFWSDDGSSGCSRARRSAAAP